MARGKRIAETNNVCRAMITWTWRINEMRMMEHLQTILYDDPTFKLPLWIFNFQKPNAVSAAGILIPDVKHVHGLCHNEDWNLTLCLARFVIQICINYSQQIDVWHASIVPLLVSESYFWFTQLCPAPQICCCTSRFFLVCLYHTEKQFGESILQPAGVNMAAHASASDAFWLALRDAQPRVRWANFGDCNHLLTSFLVNHKRMLQMLADLLSTQRDSAGHQLMIRTLHQSNPKLLQMDVILRGFHSKKKW